MHANLDGNAATVTETREVSELFNDSGELRLWEDEAGWNGSLRGETNDGSAYSSIEPSLAESTEKRIGEAMASVAEAPIFLNSK